MDYEKKNLHWEHRPTRPPIPCCCGCSSGEDLMDYEEKQELDWDNSALTVTVNPMHPDVSI